MNLWCQRLENPISFSNDSMQWLDFSPLVKYLQLEKDFFFVGITYVYICICGWGTKNRDFQRDGVCFASLAGAMKLILNAELTKERETGWARYTVCQRTAQTVGSDDDDDTRAVEPPMSLSSDETARMTSR